MNIFTIFAWISLLSSYLCISDSSSDISKVFETWCKEHGKTYGSEEEKLQRLQVFEDNYEYMQQHNSKGNTSYSLGLNLFSDLTHDEFKASYLGGVSISDSLGDSNIELPFPDYVDAIPASVDWRQKGAVTGVKYQGECNVCWAFSAAAAIESINKITGGPLVDVSEQELVDCASPRPRCASGWMDPAFQFVIRNGGIDTLKDYPYVAKASSCNKDKLKKHVVTIDGYTKVPKNNEQALLQAVAKQPVSATLCSNSKEFQEYNKGVFTGPCLACAGHAVLIVGYGSEDGKDYWIAKNSWSHKWGRDGYIYLQRNTGDPKGLCGINMYASFPVKNSKSKSNPLVSSI
ncbi:ervatamin-B-like [Mercurialis annua]|uniref:ervatamin-B-like n=1 Tax=Mercurialis annua TaxID=3986 RepID=UPI002160FFA8|nr:ervatamin-B-like [Mercurialis annua]